MTTIFKEYGISTIIAIDDAFIEVNDSQKLSDFPVEIIELLTDFERDRYADYTIKKYIAVTGKHDFISKLQEQLSDNDYYAWLKFEGFQSIGVDIDAIEQAITAIDVSDKSKKHLIVLDRMLEKTGNQKFIEILTIIKRFLKEKNLLLLIYTNENIPSEIQSFSGAKEYLRGTLGFAIEEAEELALHFNYVSKTKEISNEFFDNILKLNLNFLVL